MRSLFDSEVRKKEVVRNFVFLRSFWLSYLLRDREKNREIER